MVTIDLLTGFLGAGKTTLASKLLKHYSEKGEKTVYIVNEFGKTAIDAETIGSKGFAVKEIIGGCICCTLKSEIPLAVLEIIKEYSPDRILFETSGIFVFENFFELLKEESLKSLCRAGSVIAVADGLHFQKLLRTKNLFFENQMKHATVIVVSKFEKENPALIKLLQEMNGNAAVLCKPYSAFTQEDYELISERLFKHDEIHEDILPPHKKYMSVTFVPKPFTEQGYQQFLNKCRLKLYGDVLRMKGFMEIDGKLCNFNFVLGTVTLENCEREFKPQLTVIGDKLNKSFIESDLGLATL